MLTWTRLALLIGIVAVGASLRAGYAWLTVEANDNKSFSLIHGDSAEYVTLAENLNRYGYYADETVFDRNRALVRPPGYPLFYLGLCELGWDLNDDLPTIVWPQVAVASTVPLLAGLLGLVLSRSTLVMMVAGMGSALSPTGVAVASLATADFLFTPLFLVGIVVAAIAVPRGKPVGAAGAGLLLALAVLVKPAGLPWPLFALPLVILSGGATWRRRVGCFALTCVPMMIVAGLWTARNVAAEGVWSYSTIANRNVSYFVVTRVDLWAELGREPTADEWGAHLAEVTLDQEDYIFRTPGATPRGLKARRAERIDAALEDHPKLVGQVLASNLGNQLYYRWKSVHRQVPGDDAARTRVRVLYDATDHPAVNIAWLTLFALALLVVAVGGRAGDRRAAVFLLGLMLMIALPAATVRDEGSRLLYPAEGPFLVLLGLGLRVALDRLGVADSRER